MDDPNELACVSAYAKYLGLPDSAVQRAEDKFPELVGQSRWDYALNGENDVWNSAEIKGIVVPEFRREFSGWSDIWHAVQEELAGHVGGSFLVIGNTAWFPTQSERSALVTSVADAVKARMDCWPNDSSVDLSQEIAQRFPDWPKDIPHAEWVGQPFEKDSELKVIYPPIKLSVLRASSEGPVRFEYGSGRPITFPTRVIPSEFIEMLKKADSQLAISIRFGATSGVILLDDHKATDPSEITDAFTNISSADLPDTDEIFLVKASAGLVTKVWSKHHE